MKKILSALLLALSLVGCSTGSIERDASKEAQIKRSSAEVIDKVFDKVEEMRKDDYTAEVQPVVAADPSINMDEIYKNFMGKVEKNNENGAFIVYKNLNDKEKKEWNKKFRVKENFIFKDTPSILEAMQKAVMQTMKEGADKRRIKAEEQNKAREEKIRKMVEDAI